jgi:hypothetical protein
MMIASEILRLWLTKSPGAGLRSLAKKTGASHMQIHRFVHGKAIDCFALGKIIAWMFTNNGNAPGVSHKGHNDKKAKERRVHRKDKNNRNKRRSKVQPARTIQHSETGG